MGASGTGLVEGGTLMACLAEKEVSGKGGQAEG